MPRPVSWLPRLHPIRQAAANSVRSHFGRPEIERIFELGPRAAGKLLDLLPTVAVGTSHLVERETLLHFLDQVREAEDVPGLLRAIRAIRAAKTPPVRRALRALVPRDGDPVTAASLPPNVSLSRCRLEVDFLTLEDLALALQAVAQALAGDTDEMARRFEAEPPPPEDDGGAGDLRLMLEALREMEARRNQASRLPE